MMDLIEGSVASELDMLNICLKGALEEHFLCFLRKQSRGESIKKTKAVVLHCLQQVAVAKAATVPPVRYSRARYTRYKTQAYCTMPGPGLR